MFMPEGVIPGTFQGGIMRILIVTDAWPPQVNGVVRTLQTVGRELGKRAVEDYTEEKTIQFHRGPRTGWWVG